MVLGTDGNGVPSCSTISVDSKFVGQSPKNLSACSITFFIEISPTTIIVAFLGLKFCLNWFTKFSLLMESRLGSVPKIGWPYGLVAP